MKILYAEDEVNLRNAISAIFAIKGYEVVTVDNGEDAVKATQSQLFDIILLDIMMPKMDGLTALKIMRENQVYTPVLLLTAKSQTDDVVKGLNMGADDYIKKPFEASELLTRIEILYRRDFKYTSQIISFEEVKIDKKESKMYTEKISLSVSPIEIDIFRLLVRMKNKISSEEISQKTGLSVEDIEFYAGCLKKKIGMLNCNVEMEIQDKEYQLVAVQRNTESPTI